MHDRESAANQVKQHVERLRAAGIEYLPAPDRRLPPPVAESQSFFEEVAVEPSAPEVMDRRVALAVLTEEVKACTACSELASTRSRTVFGVGPLDAELCFIGEAPGADEDRQGEPFVGLAGQLLNRIITACGMKREEVYICNILRCRPPGNRTPKADEAANCRHFLDRTLELIQPKYICCLGACAAQNLLGVATTIGKMRNRFFDYKGMTVICTYHPSYLLRCEGQGNLEPKRQVWEDMQRLLVKMGKPIPQRGKS
jgi:uracil-DNA glycosylase family 4